MINWIVLCYCNPGQGRAQNFSLGFWGRAYLGYIQFMCNTKKCCKTHIVGKTAS